MIFASHRREADHNPKQGRGDLMIHAAFVVAQAIGGIGAFTTDLRPWYQSLNKPWWQPPDPKKRRGCWCPISPG